MITDKYLTSVAAFVINSAGVDEVFPYFNELKEEVKLPALYFPNPMVTSSSGTLDSFELEYTLFVKIIANTDELSYEIASNIQRAIMNNRRKVPVYEKDNSETGYYLRVKPSEIKKVETHTYQLTLSWTEYSRYEDTNDTGDIFSKVEFDIQSK